MPLPVKAASSLYGKAQKLLFAGIDYSVASQICASAYEGSCAVEESDDVFAIAEVGDRLDARYGSLEAMRQSAGDPTFAHSALFWLWVVEEAHRPAVILEIMNSTALKRRRIVYEYDHLRAYALAQSMAQAPVLIPDDWTFSWGGKHETMLLLNSLSVRVLYHLVAVQFGAQRYQLKGGAEHDLCLVQSTEKWVEDIEVFSQVEVKKVAEFVRVLTYGTGSNFPDQALQPLVPLGSNLLGLGPLGWLSSNADRNLLSLQARLDSRAMDRQSHLFERRMTSELLAELQRKWQRSAANLTLALRSSREELDILVCEPETKTVIVLELRWMLPPADPREVQARKSVCWQKVEQVRRKVTAVASSLKPAMLAAFDLDIDADGWTVQGMVVVEGFGGAKSPDNGIPVVPDWVLKASIQASASLRQLAQWARSLDWLPMEGREFEFAQSKPRTEGVAYTYPSISPLRTGRDYLKDATKTLNAVV
jgi:hypothetical protein